MPNPITNLAKISPGWQMTTEVHPLSNPKNQYPVPNQNYTPKKITENTNKPKTKAYQMHDTLRTELLFTDSNSGVRRET
jgi:hypothetical protein